VPVDAVDQPFPFHAPEIVTGPQNGIEREVDVIVLARNPLGLLGGCLQIREETAVRTSSATEYAQFQNVTVIPDELQELLGVFGAGLFDPLCSSQIGVKGRHTRTKR
jgi:hypothetical protein